MPKVVAARKQASVAVADPIDLCESSSDDGSLSDEEDPALKTDSQPVDVPAPPGNNFMDW
jgi:hypothetical protein